MKRMMVVLVLAAVALSAALAQDSSSRTLQGTVTDPGGSPVAKAVVQLKNTKTLAVLSFITQADGNYQFHGLDSNVDYEVKAESDAGASATKRLSSFDTKKTSIINLKLDKK